MANIFTVKHGSGQPNGKLLPFELGFDSTGKKLYIGGEKKADGSLGNAIPIAPTLSDLGITATVAELNKMDGVTASTAELNKMDGVTATTAELNVLDGITATTTELNYCSGVTSAIQTQLNNKQASITGAATTIASSDLTASRALVSNSSGKVGVSAVTATELSYLGGVTSAIQTQLNGKQATITGAATTIISDDLTKSRTLVSNGSGKVVASSVTTTELGRLSGVTSNVQTQLDGKLSEVIITDGSYASSFKIGGVRIEIGTMGSVNTTWVTRSFVTAFGDVPQVITNPIGNGLKEPAKVKNISTSGFQVCTYNSTSDYTYIAIGKA